MSEWQPIASAPKDGTEVLGWDGSYALVVWDSYYRHWEDRGGFTRRVVMWTPLPDPPQAAQGLAEGR